MAKKPRQRKVGTDRDLEQELTTLVARLRGVHKRGRRAKHDELRDLRAATSTAFSEADRQTRQSRKLEERAMEAFSLCETLTQLDAA
jgi:hypothetical protein